MKIRIDNSLVDDIVDLSEIFAEACGSFIYHAINDYIRIHRRAMERPVTQTEQENIFYTKFSGSSATMKTLKDYEIPSELLTTGDIRYCIIKAFISDEDFDYIRKISYNHTVDEPGFPMYYSFAARKNELVGPDWNDESKEELPYCDLSERFLNQVDQICMIYSITRNDFINDAIQYAIDRHSRVFDSAYFSSKKEKESKDFIVPVSEADLILRGLKYNEIPAERLSLKDDKNCIIRTFLNDKIFAELRNSAGVYRTVEPVCPDKWKDK